MTDERQAADALHPLAEVAARFGKKPDTLRKWRRRGYGPRSIKLGGEIFYRDSAVEEWLIEREQAAS